MPRLRDRLLADDDTTDSFTVTVSDGVASATTTVALPVLPAAMVTGASVGTGGSPSGVAVSGGKAYVTNQAAGTMTVINLADNTVLATVPVGASPTAVVVNSAGTRAYITNSTAGTVRVIDTTNNTLVKTITVGANPNSMALTPDGSRLFVTNGGAGTVTKINTSTNVVTVAAIAVGTAPSSVAVSPDGKFAYVANTAGDSVSVITVATNAVSKTIAAVGDSPPMWWSARARFSCPTSTYRRGHSCRDEHGDRSSGRGCARQQSGADPRRCPAAGGYHQ